MEQCGGGGDIGGCVARVLPRGVPWFLVEWVAGIVPRMPSLRHRNAALAHSDPAARHRVPARRLYSSRRLNEVIYRE